MTEYHLGIQTIKNGHIDKRFLLPIQTNDSLSHYQPIDLRLRFENPCWTENENNTSIRVACWHEGTWYDLESQIYSLEKIPGETNRSSVNVTLFF